MPRRPRLVLSDVPLHLIQRGNNRQQCFFSPNDYATYLHWLNLYAVETGCEIHAYVLMTNHVHLLLSSSVPRAVSAMMKALGQRYVQHVNRTQGRSGTLWEGRFRSSPTQHEQYFLACQRYIELNPVRAGMVQHPADYRWSSYRCNALGISNPLISAHHLYQALGDDALSRQRAYQGLFEFALEPHIVEAIRRALNGNSVLTDKQSATLAGHGVSLSSMRDDTGLPRKIIAAFARHTDASETDVPDD
jgi:putative transposase